MACKPQRTPNPRRHVDVAEAERQGIAMSLTRLDLARKVTDGQQVVLALLLGGLTEPQIAQHLERSPHTIHDYTKTIYAALGVNRRVQLILLFSRPAGMLFDERTGTAY